MAKLLGVSKGRVVTMATFLTDPVDYPKSKESKISDQFAV